MLRIECLEQRTLLAASMVADLNSSGIGTNPGNAIVVGDTLFFTADDGIHGRELWKTDGTDAGTAMVKDIAPGRPDASIGRTSWEWERDGMVDVDGTLFFTADDGVHGLELWKSDGTEAGTVLVKDMLQEGEIPTQLTEMNGSVYFTTRNGLWSSDGTEEGTFQPLRALFPYYGRVINVDGTLFFPGDGGLWKSDGTPEGTRLVKELFSLFDREAQLTNVNGTLFFVANDHVHGEELWKSDGTTAGTVMVRDIAAGSYLWGDDPPYLRPREARPRHLAKVGDTLFFYVPYDPHHSEAGLWKSDGTEEGTVRVAEVSLSYRDARQSAEVNGMFFFVGQEARKYGLWKSDGTTDGTVLVREFASTAFTQPPNNLTNVNGVLFFQADDGIHGLELWKTDGTETGTEMVRDIREGVDASFASPLANFDGTLYFSADDGSKEGNDLWKSDGTRLGTVTVISTDKEAGSSPRELTEVNGSLLFTTYTDTMPGAQLWTVDGFETTLVTTIPVPQVGEWQGEDSYLSRLIDVDGTLFFLQSYYWSEGPAGLVSYDLWKSSGDQAGTTMLSSNFLLNEAYVIDFRPPYQAAVDDDFYFSSDRSNLSRANTTAGEVFVVKSDIWPMHLENAGNKLFFFGTQEESGRELWTSDGTSVGTHLVKDIHSGPESSIPLDDETRGLSVDVFAEHASVSGLLYFPANDGTHGTELWKSDGTEAGTLLVRDISPGTAGSDLMHLIDVSGTLLFSVGHDDGLALWKSDGTQAGTVLVKDGFQRLGLEDVEDPGSQRHPNFWAEIPPTFTAIHDSLYFAAATDTGLELWHSDGTEAGTSLVKDIRAGQQGSGPRDFTVVDDALYFTADDGVHGREIWKTDGTEAGTLLAAEVFPGNNGSDPSDLVFVRHQLYGDRLFFAADDGQHGKELWQLEVNERPFVGDANGDGEIGFADFVILANNFGQSTDEGVAAGDFDEDGVVSLADFHLLAANFGRSQTPAPLARSAQAVDAVFKTSEALALAEKAEQNDVDSKLKQIVTQLW